LENKSAVAKENLDSNQIFIFTVHFQHLRNFMQSLIF